MSFSVSTSFKWGRSVLPLTLAVAASVAVIAETPHLLQDAVPMRDGDWSNDADKFSFAILGDKTSGGEGKWPIYDRAVDSMNLLDPDFVITVGDMIPGHMEERAQWDAEWAEYNDHAKRIDAPVFYTVGNHDIANVECYEFWREDLGRTYYSFDYKDCHFLVLNTEEERFDGRGPRWEAMMTFAEDDLAGHAESRHTFLFFHKPMWDDPRYLNDWARLETALEGHRFTAVAGHEHYQMTERRNGNLYVVQSATGGGIHLSDVKEYGCFHSFGFVTVDGDDVRYALVEPEGGIWPVDVAPASFRRGIVFDLVTLDAAMPEGLGTSTVTIEAALNFHNVLPEAATVRSSIAPVQTCGWTPLPAPDSGWEIDGESVSIARPLEPGQKVTERIRFEVPAERLSFPPAVSQIVEYKGSVLTKESRRMEEVNVVPVYPASAVKAIPAWQIAGPFRVGPIDTGFLPEDPAKANPNFYKRFGPEEGYDVDRVYGDGVRWRACDPLPKGLLNFNALMGTTDLACAYALCGVYSPADQLVHATVCADNFAQVFLNGELVEDAQAFGAPGGFVYVPLQLEPGWNTVVAKLINNRADWFLRFLIADPLDNLEFADHPPAD
jgi:hypothetical protein